MSGRLSCHWIMVRSQLANARLKSPNRLTQHLIGCSVVVADDNAFKYDPKSHLFS